MLDSTKPFLKWPGGKRWLVPRIRKLVCGQSFTRYLEPFLGGGAVFFGLAPPNAILADVNPEIVNAYREVKRNPERIIKQLKKLPVDKHTFLRVRASCPSTSLKSVTRFLYLNRTGFGGMYRLNRQGRFNVPFGGGQRTPSALWEDNLLIQASLVLRGAAIMAADFERTLKRAREGDLVYCDPTYTVAHNSNSFIRYNERNFSWDDQQRLARSCIAAAARGAIVIVSNADHEDVRQLYPLAEKYKVQRWSGLCPVPSKRQMATELLMVLNRGAV